MPEPATSWAAESAWAGLLTRPRLGRPHGAPGLVVEPIDGMGLASIIAAPGRGRDLAFRMEAAFGARPPAQPAVVSSSDVAFVWSGPDHWLAVSDRPDLPKRLAAEAGDLAAVADQTDSRALLRLTGPRITDVLAKGCPIDLHPAAFGPGAAAVTSISHVGVQLWRPDAESFVLAVSRSYAGSFWSWLSASAAEFGCDIRA